MVTTVQVNLSVATLFAIHLLQHARRLQKVLVAYASMGLLEVEENAFQKVSIVSIYECNRCLTRLN